MTRVLIFIMTLLSFADLGFAARPQEPTRPYPYDEEEVIFQNASDDVSLAGTLTLPRTSGPFPAVILLHGSAPLDRDSSMAGHKFFLVWADHLTRQGIAVLRFDKRSAGKSTGDYETATLENFAKDALAAVEYLKSRSEINSNQIGFIGHSEGGMTAILAASKSADIAFVVSMAAPFVNGEELTYTQEALLQRVDGVEEDMIAQNRLLREQIFAILKEEESRDVAETKLRDTLTIYFQALNPSQKEIAEAIYGSLENQIRFFNSLWFRYYLTYDPTLTVKQVNVPILALNGDHDLIVSSEQNLNPLAQALTEINHKDFTILEMPGLNHAFQTCQTGSMKEVEKIEETTSPVVLNILSDWVLQKTYNANN